MGVAAYQRGSALVRAQIEQDLGDSMRAAGERTGRANREDRLNDKVELLTAMLGEKSLLAESLQSQLTSVVSELVDEKSHSEIVRRCWKRMRHQLASVTMSWQKCSAMLRRLSTEKVQELRESVESSECPRNG